MDDFLGAMEMVAEDVDAEIAEKNKGSCNAQMVNFHRVKMSTLILALVWWCIQVSFPSALAEWMSSSTSLL